MEILMLVLGVAAGVSATIAWNELGKRREERAEKERNWKREVDFQIEHLSILTNETMGRLDRHREQTSKDFASIDRVLRDYIDSKIQTTRDVAIPASTVTRMLKDLEVNLRSDFESELQKIRKSKGMPPPVPEVTTVSMQPKKKGTDVL